MKAIHMIIPLSLLAITALAQDVRYNYAAGHDFSKHKTYKWVQIQRTEQLDQLSDEQLRTSVDAELATKGLTRTENENANLFIAYQFALSQEKEYTSFDSGWGYGYGWRGGGLSTTTSSTINVGQLGLDIYDAGEKKLIWRGTASKTLDPKAKPEKRRKNIQKAVTKLLKNYPPVQK
jgi:hypothetical protein